MRLLVTGGAGFIGSNFVRHVLANHVDWKVVNLDKLTYAGNLENLSEVQDDPRYSFVRGDIADRRVVDEIFQTLRPDVVVNFAAESHVDRSILDAAPFINTNVKGTQVLLEVSRQHGVSRFIQISTDEVYGSLPLKGGTEGPTGASADAFTEKSPLAPNSPYAASKAAADLMVRAYHKTYGLPAIITRCSNNYGPYQFPEKLIPLMITNALEDKPLPVYGDGLNVRDWVHVEDHCKAIAAVIQHGIAGEVYNIGANCEMANIDVIKAILQHLDKPETLITFVPDRLGHDRRYAIDASKLREELGWEPQFRLLDALPALIDWYRTHEAWWRRIKTGEYLRYYERVYGQARTATAKGDTGKGTAHDSSLEVLNR